MNHRGVGALGEHGGGREADDDERNDPTDDSLAKDEPVDAVPSFKQGDAHGGADLAVRGGERPAHARTEDDDASGAEFDADATAGGQFSDLRTERVENAIAIEGETQDDSKTAQGKDPVSVVTHVRLGGFDLTGLVRDNDDSKRTDGVGDVVRTVTKRITARSQDLKIAHAQLCLLVELLSVGVDSIHSHILIENILGLVVERNFKVILNGIEDTQRRTKDANRVLARLTDNRLFNLLTRSAFSLVNLLLVVIFLGFLHNQRCNVKVRKNADAPTDAESDGARRPHGSVAQAKVRRPLVHDKENVDDQSSAKHDGERNCRTGE